MPTVTLLSLVTFKNGRKVFTVTIGWLAESDDENAGLCEISRCSTRQANSASRARATLEPTSLH
jgi:hypothetical protein